MSHNGIATRITRHDDIYERLIAMHEGRSDDESRKLNAKLILALVNQVGDADTVLALIDMVSGHSERKSNRNKGAV